MDVARTKWQCSEHVEQPFLSKPPSHHVNEVHTTTCLRCHYVHTMPLLCYYCVLILPHPHYASFFNVQSSTTSFTSMKTLLRSKYFLQVSTTLLLNPTSSYCIHQFFQGRSKNMAEGERGIKCVFLCYKVCGAKNNKMLIKDLACYLLSTYSFNEFNKAWSII